MSDKNIKVVYLQHIDERLYIDYANLKVYSGVSRKEELHLIGILKDLVE